MATTAAAALAACGITAHGEAGAPPDAVIPDASPTFDASTPRGDANASDAAPLPSECVSFKNNIAPFTYDGDSGGYTLNTQGVTLTIASGKSARLFHTFDAKKIFTRSLVDAHVGIAWDSGAFGGDGNDYMTLFQQFHGSARDSSLASRIDVTLAQSTMELNVWAPIQTTYAIGGMDVPGPDAHLVLDTTWASGTSGDVVISVNPPKSGPPTWETKNIPTTATGPTDKLTVVLGGSGVNDVPNFRVTFAEVCVTFDP
jgi:hypothetical protein